MPGEYGVLHLTDLVQSDVPHRFHCSIFWAQMAFSHGQTVCAFWRVVLLKRPVEVHQVMQTDGLIGFVVYQQTPIFPMTVSIAHQIIQNVHHIVAGSIQL